MSLVQLCFLLVGSLAIGAVVGWALNGISRSDSRPSDYTDIEQADKESARD